MVQSARAKARIGGTGSGTCAGMGTSMPAVTEALAATPEEARRAALARLALICDLSRS